MVIFHSYVKIPEVFFWVCIYIYMYYILFNLLLFEVLKMTRFLGHYDKTVSQKSAWL